MKNKTKKPNTVQIFNLSLLNYADIILTERFLSIMVLNVLKKNIEFENKI